MIDVVSLGELLIDFTPQKNSNTAYPTYTAHPGGAPANVVVALSRLGHQTAMIASVGDDYFGKLLKDTLAEKGVQIDYIALSHTPTTLSFVHLENDGERSFSFYRERGADVMVAEQHIDEALIKKAKMLHIGSISMTGNPARAATRKALKIAKREQKIITYDPNYRPLLWESEQVAKQHILEVIEVADIVKLSLGELKFLTSEDSIEKAANKLLKTYDITLLFVTVGSEGSYAYHADGEAVFVKGKTVYAIDTTGCGDAFFAGALAYVLEQDLNISQITEKQLEKLTSFGNMMGAYVSTHLGGIPAMPTKEEITQFIEKN